LPLPATLLDEEIGKIFPFFGLLLAPNSNKLLTEEKRRLPLFKKRNNNIA
jgi:hypothetical protein